MSLFSSLWQEDLTRELRTNDSTDLFTDARRQAAILAGEREFADLTECLIRETSIACSNGVREYDLLVLGSTSFSRMAPQGPEYRLVSSVSTAAGSTQRTAGDGFRQTDFPRLNREQPGWRDSTGADLPTGWYLRAEGGRLYFGFTEPPEIGTSETGTLTVPYVAHPSQSTNSTSEPFTVSSQVRVDLRVYHPALVHWAAHELEKYRGDLEASNLQLSRFQGYVTRYLEQRRQRSWQRVSLGLNYFARARRSPRRWAAEGATSS